MYVSQVVNIVSLLNDFMPCSPKWYPVMAFQPVTQLIKKIKCNRADQDECLRKGEEPFLYKIPKDGYVKYLSSPPDFNEVGSTNF